MRRSILFLALVMFAGTGLLTGQSSSTTRSAARSAAKPKPAAGGADVVDASGLGTPLLLDTGWRVGISSDFSAAQPGFDDSAWAIRNAAETIPEVVEPGSDAAAGKTDGKAEGKVEVEDRSEESIRRLKGPESERLYAWFRLHLQLPAHHGPLALLVELPVPLSTSIPFGSPGQGLDVYANGQLVRPGGPNSGNPASYQPITRLYDLKIPADQTQLVLVVRTLYLPVGFGAYTNFFADRKLILGDPRTLNHSLEGWNNRVLFERIPKLVVAILLLVLANFLLGLYFGQKGHSEYLWLALHELVQAPIAYIDLAGSTARLDRLWFAAFVIQLVLLSAYLYFEFLVAFLSLSRRRWYVRVLRFSSPVLLAVGPSLLLVGHHRSVVGVVLILAGVLSAFWLLGWLVFVFFTLFAAAVRRNLEAGLLLIPLVLNFIGTLIPIVTMAVSDVTGKPIRPPLTFDAGPIPISFTSVADFAGIFVIVLIIFFRFLRIQRDQERASTELAAARTVQELIIPREKIATPGFEVDSVYEPANEVGGDFYFVQPTEDGGLLVVVGDVAGKGLKAALNVSMIMGALRGSKTHKPAELLTELNRVLRCSESFTTCAVAWFGPTGELTLASAGHLPPYLNSQEVAMPGGLPLGVVAEMEYDEVRLFLHPGDRMLMLSDGVVEARRPSGELFGFDRVHNLSNQTAFYIADAARSWGQDDDITVLTVRRLD